MADVQSGLPGHKLDEVLSSLQRLRVHTVNSEHDLHRAIGAQFVVDHISFSREVRLGPRNRVDFLILGGIAVEVKKGKPNSGDVSAQIERYCRFDTVQVLILVVERNVFAHLDQSTNGKPVHYVALNKLWGIAL